MTKASPRSPDVDAYLAAQPPAVRRALAELRACIRQAAPGATELMNYRIPAFALVPGGKRDQQVMIAGFAKHVGFYPHPETIAAFADRLGEYKFGKGSVQFPLGRAVPVGLVAEMVRWRVGRVRG